jgi:hypothetical protein
MEIRDEQDRIRLEEHFAFLNAIRQTSGEERVNMAFELTSIERQELKAVLRHTHPELSERELHRKFLIEWTSLSTPIEGLDWNQIPLCDPPRDEDL